MNPVVKKILIIVSSFFGAALVVAAIVMYFVISSGFEEYRNDQAGVRLLHPKDWIVTPMAQEDVVVVFKGPKAGPLDPYPESFSITTKDMKKYPMNIDQYAATIANQMTGVFKNMKMIPPVKIVLGELPGYRIVFQSEGGDDAATMAVYAIMPEKDLGMNLTYFGSTPKFLKNAWILSIMTSSFRLF
ncbi:MAG: hypothetical protein HQL19_07400 [Candidatus Omnitrophica bacterium]|nr:hypothetical protein [Candidatus Omnitrophota bacterium]